MKPLKTLHLVRHAKSAWGDDGIADIDRPLKPKGVKNAYEIARKIKLSNLVPQVIIASPAIRALHTAVIFARIFELPSECIVINNLLYESSVEKILHLIRNFDDSHNSVMLFGHNPDFTDVANTFLEDSIDNLPTAAAVSLRFKISGWKQIDRNTMESYFINYPMMEK